MRSRVVFTAAWVGPLPLPPGVQSQAIPWERFKRALEPRPGGSLLVLGNPAFDRLSPMAVARPLHYPYGIVLAVPDVIHRADLGPWRAIGEGLEVISREEAPQRLTAALETPARVEVPPGAWLPSGVDPGSPVGRTLLALPQCVRIRPGDWAAALGLSLKSLERLAHGLGGRTPQALCDTFVWAYATQEKARGIPEAYLAAALGFGGPSSLERALRRHRRPLDGGQAEG